jgi:L-aminopeptidase/D-esterase-like protein
MYMTSQILNDFRIGHAQDYEALTGCTVIIAPNGAVCGVDVRGGSPGTRDTDALNPVMNREVVHAVLLSGGSSYGLDAAGGVMSCLEARGIGRDAGVTIVPNVCAAVLFDLRRGRADVRPDATMGYAACTAAFSDEPLKWGAIGAGTGCAVGKVRGMEHAQRGGIGYVELTRGTLTVAAAVAVNCVGDVTRDGAIVAGTLADDGSFADSESVILSEYRRGKDFFSGKELANSDGNTVLACVITNAGLNKSQATKLAQCGQNGIARCVRPAHSVYDGDTVFTMCGGGVSAALDAVCILAAKAVESAIVAAVESV